MVHLFKKSSIYLNHLTGLLFIARCFPLILLHKEISHQNNNVDLPAFNIKRPKVIFSTEMKASLYEIRSISMNLWSYQHKTTFAFNFPAFDELMSVSIM